MIIIWMTAFIYLVMGYLLEHYIADTTYLTFSFIIIVTLVLFFTLFMKYTQFIVIIFAGFLARLAMVMIDLSQRGPTIPHSGEDTENFYDTGIMISEKMSLLGESVYGGTYSKLLGIIFYIYGDDRLFVQFLNVLFTITAILIVIQIFRMLEVPAHVQMILVVVMTFFPHSLIFSSILLREAVISLMVVLSLYCFVRWFTRRERFSGLMSVVLILLGAAFHSAIIGILIGYLFGFIFYRHDWKAFRFTVQSVVPFSIFALITAYILIFPGVVSGLPIFNKFDQVLNNNDNVYEAFTSTRGETAYLTGVEINNLFQLLLFSPIKLIYFISSPMPWSVRNFNDLISFFLDALFYIATLAIFIRYFSAIRQQPILAVLLLIIFTGWFIFGLGISNAGTALRHRFKLFYVIIVALGVIWSRWKR